MPNRQREEVDDVVQMRTDEVCVQHQVCCLVNQHFEAASGLRYLAWGQQLAGQFSLDLELQPLSAIVLR